RTAIPLPHGIRARTSGTRTDSARKATAPRSLWTSTSGRGTSVGSSSRSPRHGGGGIRSGTLTSICERWLWTYPRLHRLAVWPLAADNLVDRRDEPAIVLGAF